MDMGKPVKILDMAEDLIRLSGLEPYKDIDITFCGLRPGEKLFEELLTAEEGTEATKHEKIFVAGLNAADSNHVNAVLRSLQVASEKDEIITLLEQVVPRYRKTPAKRHATVVYTEQVEKEINCSGQLASLPHG